MPLLAPNYVAIDGCGAIWRPTAHASFTWRCSASRGSFLVAFWAGMSGAIAACIASAMDTFVAPVMGSKFRGKRWLWWPVEACTPYMSQDLGPLPLPLTHITHPAQVLVHSDSVSRLDAVGRLGSLIRHEAAYGIGLRTGTHIRITGERARITGDTPPKLSVHSSITPNQNFMGV